MPISKTKTCLEPTIMEETLEFKILREEPENLKTTAGR
jgi:hypothetical protein